MKKCIFLAVALVFFGAAFAIAGEDPYVAIVGQDNLFDGFYFSPKQEQFMYDPALMGLVAPFPTEFFRSNKPINQPEVCDTQGQIDLFGFKDRGLKNARFNAGNAGTATWQVFLPKKPNGEINLCIECGVLKPNAFAIYGYEAVKVCAAEEGEIIGFGVCSRMQTGPGQFTVVPTALPTLTCTASPGPQSLGFAPFNLTAYKNPSTYAITGFSATGTGAALVNDGITQVLAGTIQNRILLKSCMDKCVIAKLPVAGQVNALGQVEADLEQGDLITCTLSFPRGTTVDTYCSAQSFKVAGIGEAP